MKKFVFAPVILLAGLSLATAPTLLAQAPAATDQVTIKDPAEYKAYNDFATSTDPKAKAAAGETFLTTYPQSVVKKAVLDGVLGAYATFDQTKTVDAATRMLQLDPNNLKSMYLIAYIKKTQAAQVAQSNPSQQAQLLDDAAALATKGLVATKPDGVSDAEWKTQKATTDPFFHSVLAYDALYSKKDYKTAISEFRTELELAAAADPESTKKPPYLNDTLILGQTYLQLTPPDPVNAIWFLSRAEDFAPDNFKPVIDKTDKYWYNRYHGGTDGFDDIKTKAGTSVFPSTDYAIKAAPTPKEIADKAVADNPDLNALGLSDKEFILANGSKENAEKVWAIVKDQTAQFPAVVIAATASQLQLAVTDDAKADKKADVTVNLKTPLADSAIPAVGTELKSVIGTFDSYTQDPPQIILRDGEIPAEKKKPATPAHKPSAAHKKPS
jgi:hypothetical protein